MKLLAVGFFIGLIVGIVIGIIYEDACNVLNWKNKTDDKKKSGKILLDQLKQE